MAGSIHYSIYIRATVEDVFDALIDPAATQAYWLHENVSDWHPGSRWEHRSTEHAVPDIVGNVIAITRPRSLSLSWGTPAGYAADEKPSTVSFTTDVVAGVTRLTVRHDGLDAAVTETTLDAWAGVLSSLKSLLETQSSLGDLWS